MSKLLTIIVPAFNEQETIGKVLTNIDNLKIPGWEKEVIVVNDGSWDDTKKIAREYVAKNKKWLLIDSVQNYGKGWCIRRALAVAQGEKTIIQDADMEYDARDIKKLLRATTEDDDVVVYGSRNLGGKARGYKAYVLGNTILTFLVDKVFDTKLTDVFTCYKLLPTKLAESLELTSNGFEIEMEITAKLLKRGARIVEVPIAYRPRSFSEGKKFKLLKAFKVACQSVKRLVSFAT